MDSCKLNCKILVVAFSSIKHINNVSSPIICVVVSLTFGNKS